jgi:hypothetical protein
MLRSIGAMSWRRFGIGTGLAGLLGFRKVPVLADARAEGFGRLPQFALSAALSLVVVAIAFASARAGWNLADDLFWFAIAALFLPFAVRLLREDVSREERIGLIVVLGVSLYLVKVLQSPTQFIQFDELLHLQTANSILDKGRLFGLNSLLPISPLYPGLEIATTAIANATGLSIFWSGVLLLLAARIIFMLSLFLLVETISGSARVAGIASLIYMAHSGFLLFHAMFAYESFAMMFLGVLLLSEAFALRSPANLWASLWLSVPVFAALAITHHLTSAFAALLLVGLFLLQMMTADGHQKKLRAAAMAGIAVVLFTAWLFVIGNPVEDYVGPVFKSGWSEFSKLLTGQNSGRKAFVSEDGSALPFWQRASAIVAVLLTCVGLAIGFFRTLGLRSERGADAAAAPRLWSLGIGRNVEAVLLTVLTIGFPVSVLLRLTKSGWEIGNRAGALVFLGVGLVGAVGVVTFWLAGSRSRLRYGALSVALTVLFIGGAISGGGDAAVPSSYRVSADARSIEPLGIAAAEWTKEQLGGGWRFAADRVNRLLLATYGRQRLITTIEDRYDVSSMVLGKELTAEDLNEIRTGNVDFLMVDSRLARGLPVVGVYFEKGEEAGIHRAPPTPEALRKFNDLRGVGRPFDNGPISIYDVRSLHDRY